MVGNNQSMARVGNVVTRVNLLLFSLNLAWIATCYLMTWTGLFDVLPLRGEVPVIFGRGIWMPNGAYVLRQVVYSFVFSGPVFLSLLLLARVSSISSHLRAMAGPVAITGFPLYYLFVRYRFNPAFILYPGHCLELTLETLVVLTCGVLYYLRRWPIPSAVSLVILLGHFILWAWVTGNHANPFVLRHTILPEYRMSTLGVAFRVCVMMIYFNGFPAIGFLSASAAALDLKLSSQQAGSAEVVAV